MHKGRISEISYKRSVVKKITNGTEGIRPGIDAAKMELEDVTAVMSSNCVLEYFEGFEKYYLQRTINGIYEKGGTPLYLQLEINIPTAYEEKLLGKIIKNFNDAAGKKNIKISQCRVYESNINSPIIHITVLGTAKNSLSYTNIKSGMDVVMAGSAAVGGISVISEKYKEKLLFKFSGSFVENCIRLKDYTDIKTAAFTALSNGAVAMHSVSEGGVFSAIWELVSPMETGITVNIRAIPIWQETVEVAELFDINPYLIDGTGAVLIVSADGEKTAEALLEKGIYSAVIGKITDGKDRIALNGDEVRYLEPPRGDEIYKLL